MSTTRRSDQAANLPLEGLAALTDAERDLLQYIADNADMISVTYGRGANDADFRQRFSWVLVPMPSDLMAELEAFGSNRDGLEDDREGENCDDEVTWTERVNQVGLAEGVGESDDTEDDGTDELDGNEEAWFQPATLDRSTPAAPAAAYAPPRRAPAKPLVHPTLGTMVPL